MNLKVQDGKDVDESNFKYSYYAAIYEKRLGFRSRSSLLDILYLQFSKVDV